MIVRTTLVSAAVSVLAACGPSATESPTAPAWPVAGERTYVDQGYADRAQGADWVRVVLTGRGAEGLTVVVDARSDLKRPTCSFEGQAAASADGTGFVAVTQVGDIHFEVADTQLTVTAADPATLHYFCSGGASLAGDYQRLQ